MIKEFNLILIRTFRFVVDHRCDRLCARCSIRKLLRINEYTILIQAIHRTVCTPPHIHADLVAAITIPIIVGENRYCRCCLSNRYGVDVTSSCTRCIGELCIVTIDTILPIRNGRDGTLRIRRLGCEGLCIDQHVILVKLIRVAIISPPHVHSHQIIPVLDSCVVSVII
ncbi:hypothetical protein D3C73_1101640 [compost metagenome]